MNKLFNSIFNKSESTNINICLVGCVSAGKSTILNAFFGQDYAQCKIKRTTMMPNKFVETDVSTEIDSFEKINQTIGDVNKQIYTHTQNGLPLNLMDYGGELTFHVGGMEMNVGKHIKICIYDIPGLNDARTKQVYYDYLRTNFHKFNIILFVVDIQSGLNTSDEMDILNFLASNIKKHKTESNKNISMLTIVNKADDMQLSGDKLEVLGELGEMFDQVSGTVRQKFTTDGIQTNMLDCIPICGLDSHLYRMIKKFRDINKLTDENILRIGINEEGSKFRKYPKDQQRRKVQQKIQDDEFVNDMIKLSGFSQIEVYLDNFIGSKGSTMVIENILLEYSCIQDMTIDNIIENIKLRVEKLESIKTHDESKYTDEMKKLVKKANTLIYKKINTINNPEDIVRYYYQNILKSINSDPVIKLKISKFFNLLTYPNYIADRIIELVTNEFSRNSVDVSRLSYIELFEHIGYLNAEVVDLIIETLINNTRCTQTFIFTWNVSNFDLTIIKFLEKLKGSKKFLEFIRFFLANLYSSGQITPEKLVEKLLLFTKYGELPLKQFILDLRIERKFVNTSVLIPIYRVGLSENFQNSNILELYYIAKCRELGDIENFINHDIPINIDFQPANL
jgi:GTPase SAR1 family protein